MKLTKISLLLACPFTLAICAGHVKADSVTVAADLATTLVATQPVTITDSAVPIVSATTEVRTAVSNEVDTEIAATTDQDLATPTDLENQSSDSKNESVTGMVLMRQWLQVMRHDHRPYLRPTQQFKRQHLIQPVITQPLNKKRAVLA